MPTVLIRNNEPTKVAFQRASSIRPVSLIRKSPIVNPCRCLFGTPDHQEAIRIAREEIKEEQKRLANKYNFDFESCAPLPGKFLYEKIDRSFADDNVVSSLLTSDTSRKSQDDLKDKSVTYQQKNLTDFYTVSRKRSCSFETPREKSLTTDSRQRVSKVCD